MKPATKKSRAPDTRTPADRAAALAILELVINRAKPFDQAVSSALDAADELSDQDKRFARAAALWVLKNRRGLIDIGQELMEKPITQKAKQVPHIIHLGLAQIFLMDVPDHAAVDASVRLAAAVRHPQERRFKALVNAVLRRAVREKDRLIPLLNGPFVGVPAWLADRWCDAYGNEVAELIGGALQKKAPTDVSLRAPGDGAIWAKRLRATLLPTGSIRLGQRARLEALPGFSTGDWWVQDAAAALPARLLGEVRDKRVADLCAAPGGKTMQLAAAGAKVIAVDRAEERMKRLAENLTRTRLQAEMIIADAALWRPDAPVDHVLLDAPCSTTGTLRRHPDVAWIKSPEDVAALVKTQASMLDHAASLVPLGGRLVYCVCSLQPEEGTGQIEAFLQRNSRFARIPPAEDIPGLPEGSITDQGDIITLPSFWTEQGGMDGFFMSRLERVG